MRLLPLSTRPGYEVSPFVSGGAAGNRPPQRRDGGAVSGADKAIRVPAAAAVVGVAGDINVCLVLATRARC